MREIVVISGKGGTGKTSVTASFAHLAQNHVICDLDVDAPDLHLLLKPEVMETHDFYAGHQAVIRPDDCLNCGLCAELCRFDAIRPGDPAPEVSPLMCEGCKVCLQFCPMGAIDFIESRAGEWYRSETRLGPMIHAQLSPGEENSGKLVAELKKQARALAEEQGLDLMISDGSPGIGCPVISSFAGADLAVLVTEPTPSGLHDLERAVKLCEQFRLRATVIINKADLHEPQARQIRAFCGRKGLVVLAELPYDSAVTDAMVSAQTITEHGDSAVSRGIREAFGGITALLESKQAA